MSRVFISYRRSETRWAVSRVHDRLVEAFGRDHVFLDVADIEPGEDFADKIRRIIDRCDVLLAIIGPAWLTLTDRNGARRLDDPHDLVRIEIGAALQRNIRVIPLLLDEAVMPAEQDLPAELAGLARRNAHAISFHRFHEDLDGFIRVLDRVLAIDRAAPHAAAPAGAGADLDRQATLAVTPAAAARGGTHTISTADGQQITVALPAGVQSGQSLRIRGLGASAGARVGDLYVRVVVKD